MDFQDARTHMLDSQIHTAGVVFPAILEAFGTLPRESFVPEKIAKIAYSDEDLPLGRGRFLMEPLVHARMLQALDPRQHHVVLDIGCASGYSSAVLSSLVTTVVALEEDKTFLEQASRLWNRLDICNVASFCGPLVKGQNQNAPYDLIVINGAVNEVPPKILDQLAPDGRMVTILKPREAAMGQATLIRPNGGNNYSYRPLFHAGTPYLPGFSPQPAFSF